jgi:predicted DNA-binding transcriptional regulator AlpA
MANSPQLTYREISERTGISVGALRKRQSMGTMPAPDVRHGSSPVWDEETVREWMESAGPGDRSHGRR